MNGRPRIVLFPGTFDPITNGHLDVIDRGRVLFDELVVAVAHDSSKQPLFTVDERLDMIRALLKDLGPGLRVMAYHGLTVDCARTLGANAILRGLRNVTDLNYEFQLALTNRSVGNVETLFIMTGESYGFTSSTLIKQIAVGGDISRLHRLLPPLVLEQLKKKKAQLGPKFRAMHDDGLTE